MRIPEPYSAGLFLTYKCNCACKHCLYASSARWPADWISQEDAEQVLTHLAQAMRGKYPHPGRVGVNDGLHFTGGEPFLNFDLLLRLTEMAGRLGIPTLFVETNGFWCRDDATTRQKMQALREAGLHGILISANPFILERIPFERTERAVRIARQVFGYNAIVYQEFFFRRFQQMGLSGTLSFEEYVQRAGYGLRYAELLPGGRVPFKLAPLFQHYPAGRFFGLSCRAELIREWHVHVDNYGNLVPGFCGGLSLGDARDLPALYEGLDLDRRPVLKALLTDLQDLYRLGKEFGYREREGYISKCHLCLDIRRHLARHGDFVELRPAAFYERLED
ncbi:MAG TPA: radical SAM protein [Anaerolineae bacterium]|nr:radical SAM protein [Anaerolineae bacterium]HIQ06434.1 radical SAM protein [Anaerolineae bacterium]